MPDRRDPDWWFVVREWHQVVAMASSTSSLAARRAGHIAAIMPASTASTKMAMIVPTGKATELMMDVHEKGRAVVSNGTREKAELDVFRLHEHGLWATMQRDDA